MKSDGYQSVKFDIYNNELEKTNNIYSLLPDIYITTGQSAHNDSGFRPPIYNLAGLSVSQSIYSGGSYINSREKLELNEKEFSRNISENRVLYILNIYADTLKIKSIDRLIGFYEERLSEQETEHKKLNVLYAQGDISENEVKLGLDEIRTYKDNISRFKMERDNVLMDLKEKYKLTPDLLQHITKETVRSCKREGLSSLLEKENAINKRRITLDHEIEK
ncbi:TolC family protein [Escherichia coli]|uniref:TolC family protein n=1 Tax=Escherichia coli TaxID=562 RepID=UPI0029C37AE5|nr:TolC family protein [Escherichia coli]MDX5601633.1 TolC family protein [Escherichia coli]